MLQPAEISPRKNFTDLLSNPESIAFMHSSTRFFQGIFCLLLLEAHTARAQNFRSQQGFCLSAGISRPGDFQNFLHAFPEPGTRRFQAFSWEAGFLRIRSISPAAAFSQGLTLRMAGADFRRDSEIWAGSSHDSLLFGANRQRQESYFLSLPFRWSFFLNRHPGRRWFLGPGISISIPVFTIWRIRGNDRNGMYHSLSRQNFPEKGPYAFLCPELETGYQTEFPDCSLLRISLFTGIRAIGLFRPESSYTLQHFSGLRFCWFFGND
jgi:hypothetical protein